MWEAILHGRIPLVSVERVMKMEKKNLVNIIATVVSGNIISGC